MIHPVFLPYVKAYRLFFVFASSILSLIAIASFNSFREPDHRMTSPIGRTSEHNAIKLPIVLEDSLIQPLRSLVNAPLQADLNRIVASNKSGAA